MFRVKCRLKEMSPCGRHTETANRLYRLIWERRWDREEDWDKKKTSWGDRSGDSFSSSWYKMLFLSDCKEDTVRAGLHYVSNYCIQRLPNNHWNNSSFMSGIFQNKATQTIGITVKGGEKGQSELILMQQLKTNMEHPQILNKLYRRHYIYTPHMFKINHFMIETLRAVDCVVMGKRWISSSKGSLIRRYRGRFGRQRGTDCAAE